MLIWQKMWNIIKKVKIKKEDKIKQKYIYIFEIICKNAKNNYKMIVL